MCSTGSSHITVVLGLTLQALRYRGTLCSTVTDLISLIVFPNAVRMPLTSPAILSIANMKYVTKH